MHSKIQKYHELNTMEISGEWENEKRKIRQHRDQNKKQQTNAFHVHKLLLLSQKEAQIDKRGEHELMHVSERARFREMRMLVWMHTWCWCFCSNI